MKDDTQRILQNKWGKNALKMGWVAVPTKLLFLQEKLGISPVGMNLIMNLLAHWWDKEQAPYPSQESIASRMGVSKRTIQREVTKLIELDLIEKIPSEARDKKYRGRNIYKLDKLVNMLNI